MAALFHLDQCARRGLLNLWKQEQGDPDMSVSLQVIYPVGDDTHFDYEYYIGEHMRLVSEHMGPHIQNTLVTKGLAGGPDTPAGFYAVASIIFADNDAMNAAMASAGPVLADLPNFTNVRPAMLIGEVIG